MLLNMKQQQSRRMLAAFTSLTATLTLATSLVTLCPVTPAQAKVGPGGLPPEYRNRDITLDIEDEQPFTYNSTAALYTTTANLHVTATKPYGFNLTMQATSNALTNTLNSSHQIPSLATNNQALGTNQWGYTLANPDTLSHSSRFNPIPTTSTTPATATILDVAPANPTHSSNTNPNPCTSLTNCTTKVLYAANLNPATLPTGTYQTTITYTVTAKPAPKFTNWYQRTARKEGSGTCRSGDTNSSCLVDLDKNLIPVKYTGNYDHAEWTTIAHPEDTTNPGNWYDYSQKQWANAVTIKLDKLAKYQGKATTLDEQDVLGYYTYVPRYAYEVMRRDGTDDPVEPDNFNIVFETANTPKKHPAKCATGANHDYRTECNRSRNYPTGGYGLDYSTWSTHPAFTFGTKELNGIWVGKFETTGYPTDPTILPNQRHLAGFDKGVDQKLGRFYTIAKSLGAEDPANTYGDQAGVAITQNSHHLDTFSSRMPTNSDWGAIAYLSASRYGAGHGNVQINTQWQNHTLDGHSSYGTTGCGPSASGNKNTYDDGGTLGTQSACSTSNLQHAYNGSLGQLASTTNNPTGIYDLAGGGFEYVSAARTTDNISGQLTSYFPNTPHRPYANLYYNTDKNSFNSCTYESCGGQALYETNNGQGDSDTNQWHDQWANFASSDYPWVERGGYAYWSNGGVFGANASSGRAFSYHSLRVVLAPTVR